jgi:hypothetical protein
LRAPPKLA